MACESRHRTSIVKTCYQLTVVWQCRLDAQYKLAIVVGQTRLTVLSYDWQPRWVYHTEHPPSCTARWARISASRGPICEGLRPFIDQRVKSCIILLQHYLHSMRSRVYETVRCPSVCPSMGPQQKTRGCRFAAVGPAGRKYWSIAAAAACECGQCYVVSVCAGSWPQPCYILLCTYRCNVCPLYRAVAGHRSDDT